MMTKAQTASVEQIMDAEHPGREISVELFYTDHYAILRFEPHEHGGVANPSHLPRYWIIQEDGEWEEAQVH